MSSTTCPLVTPCTRPRDKDACRSRQKSLLGQLPRSAILRLIDPLDAHEPNVDDHRRQGGGGEQEDAHEAAGRDQAPDEAEHQVDDLSALLDHVFLPWPNCFTNQRNSLQFWNWKVLGRKLNNLFLVHILLVSIHSIIIIHDSLQCIQCHTILCNSPNHHSLNFPMMFHWRRKITTWYHSCISTSLKKLLGTLFFSK